MRLARLAGGSVMAGEIDWELYWEDDGIQVFRAGKEDDDGAGDGAAEVDAAGCLNGLRESVRSPFFLSWRGGDPRADLEDSGREDPAGGPEAFRLEPTVKAIFCRSMSWQ